MRTLFTAVVALAVVSFAGIFVIGCGGSGTPQVKQVEVPMPTGVERAKLLLKQYAQGQPLGSEVEEFPQIIEEAKKADPQKGAILEQGLNNIRTNPNQRVKIAEELLQKL
jgi:hypothetical protein